MASSTLHTGTRTSTVPSLVEPARRVRHVLHTPAAVLLASCALAGAFLVAVSDLASRLG